MKEIINYLSVKEDGTPTDEAIKLGERSDEVDTVKGMKEAREIISEIKSTMRKKNLPSLSAPSIGYSKRIFCINYANSEIKTYINPVISNSKGMVLSREKSINVPEKEFIVPRMEDITIIYTSPLGKIESKDISGLASAVVQQEIHLLEGIVLSDIGAEIPEGYDEWEEEKKIEFTNEYLDSLDIAEKEIQKEIREDPEAKKIDDAINFLTSVNKGETKLERI